MCNYFKIRSLINKRSFKVFFSIFSHLVHPSNRSGLSNFGRRYPKEYSCEIILKLDKWLWRRCHFKVFLFLALAAILFSGAKPFRQLWYRVP